jgi:predicted transcriptional regulator
MEALKLADSEIRIMNIVWENEPINSTELVKLANQILGWKKSTTYTMIKRLNLRGALKNENATVTSIAPKSAVQKSESRELLEKMYGGSLQMFLLSFLGDVRLTEEEAAGLKRIIDEKTKEST